MATTPGSVTQGFVEDFEDFNWYANDLTDINVRTTVASGATLSRIGHQGGWLRSNLAGDDADATMVATSQCYIPKDGSRLVVEGRIKTNNVGKTSTFFGLSDATTETEAVVIEYEDGALNVVPSDAAGFLLEGEDDERWRAIGVKGGANTGLTKLGGYVEDRIPVAVRLEVNAEGDVWFAVDGKVEFMGEKYLNPNNTYCLVWSCDDRGTAVKIDLDYYLIRQPRFTGQYPNN